MFFFSTGKISSRAITPEGNCLSTVALTLKLTQTLSLTGGKFSFGGLLRTTVKTKETKSRKKIKNIRRKKNETEEAKFYQIKTNSFEN